MKKSVIGIFTVSILMIGCNEASPTSSEETTIDSTVIVEEDKEEVEETLAFNGVDRGEYILFGREDIISDEAVSQEEMFNIYAETGSFNGKVHVVINEVCQKAGCWINIKKTEDENVMVFFRDHFTIPIEESAGKEAILYGYLESDTLSVDFQRHLLDDAAEAGDVINQSDYDAITEDKIDVSFDCVSILLK